MYDVDTLILNLCIHYHLTNYFFRKGKLRKSVSSSRSNRRSLSDLRRGSGGGDLTREERRRRNQERSPIVLDRKRRRSRTPIGGARGGGDLMPLKRRRRRRGGRRRRDRRRRGRRGREGMLSSEKLRHFENLKEENKEMQVKFLIVKTSILDFFLFSSDATLCLSVRLKRFWRNVIF